MVKTRMYVCLSNNFQYLGAFLKYCTVENCNNVRDFIHTPTTTFPNS